MGKKKLGGGGAKRPAGSASHGNSSGLVVVNPVLMQSALRSAPSAASSNKSKSKKNAPKPKQQQQQNKKRALDASSGGNGTSSNNKKHKKSKTSFAMNDGGRSFERKPKKRAQQSPVVSASVVSAVTSAGLFGTADGLKKPISLIVPKDEHVLAGAYWIALSRAAKRSCVVVVPNNHDVLTPPRVAGAFRHLGMQAIAIHKKMTAGQRKESVERLARTAQLASDASQLLLVTTEHFAASAVCPDADVLLLDVTSQEKFSKAAAIFQVMPSGDVSSYRPELHSTVLQQVSARLKLATQITAIAERLALSNAKDVDAKWASKLARGADLDDSDDDSGINNNGGDDDDESGRAKRKKRALSPDEQRLQALSEKLAVLVARKLDVPVSKNTSAANTASTSAAPASDNQHAKEKLEILGLVTLTAAVGAALGDERFSAQTRWMDAASGRAFGGAWDGDVRHGASKDATSLMLREQVCAARQSQQRKPAAAKPEPRQVALREWQPNENPADVDKWGGAFGKVCGHNEVVMHALRPFYPQEVLNSRVCSRVFPAPGNQGFDGCLEHLRLQCRAQAQAMTLWDAECFIYISPLGCVTWTRKNQLLGLSLASLQCLVPAMRRWTVASNGQVPPAHVLAAIQLCCSLGSAEAPDATLCLEPKLLKRIMAFALGGSVRLWKQIAKVAPLDNEVVY